MNTTNTGSLDPKTAWCKKCGERPDEDGCCDCCDPGSPYLGAYNGPRLSNEHFPGVDEETDDSPCLPEPPWSQG